MVFKDYYKILDLKTIRVNKEEIKNAYRNQAKKYHPDINNQSNDEIIKDINEAYKVLSNSDSKKKYDRLWISYVGKNDSKSYIHKNRREDIFGELKQVFFGSTTSVKKKKDEKLNEVITLDLTIEEAYNGAVKYIKKNGKDIKLNIPEKSKSRDIIKIVGQGKPDSEKPEIKGDLLIDINVLEDENKEYVVNGINLERNLGISPAEAVLGVKKEIDIFGEKMSVIIPERVQTGYTYKIKNKGFKSNNKTNGMLIIKLVIKTPEIITEEEKEIYKKLYEIQKNQIDY